MNLSIKAMVCNHSRKDKNIKAFIREKVQLIELCWTAGALHSSLQNDTLSSGILKPCETTNTRQKKS